MAEPVSLAVVNQRIEELVCEYEATNSDDGSAGRVDIVTFDRTEIDGAFIVVAKAVRLRTHKPRLGCAL